MSVLSDQNLYLLAFDHRASFVSGLLGVHGTPSAEQNREASDLKQLIYEGFTRALGDGAPAKGCGVLVDEQFGSAVAHAAAQAGVRLAMSVEKSGQEEFDFEYGDEFGDHIEAFDPDFAKVLVRYNPDGDADLNARQSARLATLSQWLHERDRLFLFELLIPPTDAQDRAAHRDRLEYEQRMLPDLTVRTIAALQGAGVEPDIWKIEGMDDRAADTAAAAQARSGGRDHVACIVLGHGEDAPRVRGWLVEAAATPGYEGFAIGRTIWLDALQDFVAGRCDRDAAASRIARAYRRMIDTYAGVAQTSP